MRITEAAQRLGTSPRMLRYRDLLGLLPAVRRMPTGHGSRHRRFGDDDLAAVSLALGIEQRYDVSPAALAFGLRVLTEPGVRADVAELGRRIGRIGPLPSRALEFEKERALRLLSLAPGRRPQRPQATAADVPERRQAERPNWSERRAGRKAEQRRLPRRPEHPARQSAKPAPALSRPQSRPQR